MYSIVNVFMIWILHGLYVNALKDTCTTPSGQTGVCIPIRSCSILLPYFANYKHADNEYFKQYICSEKLAALKVCCAFNEPMNKNQTYNTDISLSKLTNSEECGLTRNPVTHNGVIGFSDFPWLVKIMSVNNTYVDIIDRGVEKVGCTGVLINNAYVLYSAICHKTVLVKGPNIFVRIETFADTAVNCSTSSYSPECSNFELYDVVDFVVHIFYDPITKLNDLAVLKLNHQVHFSEFMKPICLPTSNEPVKEGQTLYTAGWNRTYLAKDISVKKSQTSVLISNIDCENVLGNNTTISSYEMCTGSKKPYNDLDAVGSPVMSFENGRWYLQGFESMNYEVKVHLRVQRYLQWIEEITNQGGCTLPFNSNQIGECVSIGFCPKLFDAFANASPKNENSLRQFICHAPLDVSSDLEDVLRGCCGFNPEFTIPPETIEINLDFEVSNYKFCGFQHRDNYISNDDTISIDEFPWLAVIMNATLPNQRDRVCAGSLITHRYVVTSGQCNFWFDSNEIMLVRLGDYNLKNSSDCVEFTEFGALYCNDIREYGIEKKIVHPFFNKYTYYNDIALLRLNETIIFTNYIRPICLPRSENDLAKEGATLISTGFGDYDRVGTEPKIKKKLRATLITNEVCQAKYNLLSLVYPITSYQMCTESLSTDITCVGDEGGPLMHSKKTQWFIHGITSVFSCKNEAPHISVNIFKYLKWIKLNIKNY